MLNKLLIPSLIFAASVAIGCSSSSSTPKDGGAGSGGGTAGGTAGSTAGSGGGTAGSTAGSGGGTAGAAGGTAGAAGGTAGAAGSTAGSDGGTAGHDGGGSDATGAAGSDGGSSDGGTVMACPASFKESTNTAKLDAVIFCENFLANCTGISGFTIPADYATESACEATWTANTTAVGCRSYHLCGNAVGKDLAARTLHCPHALGMNGVCAN